MSIAYSLAAWAGARLGMHAPGLGVLVAAQLPAIDSELDDEQIR